MKTKLEHSSIPGQPGIDSRCTSCGRRISDSRTYVADDNTITICAGVRFPGCTPPRGSKREREQKEEAAKEIAERERIATVERDRVATRARLMAGGWDTASPTVAAIDVSDPRMLTMVPRVAYLAEVPISAKPPPPDLVPIITALIEAIDGRIESKIDKALRKNRSEPYTSRSRPPGVTPRMFRDRCRQLHELGDERVWKINARTWAADVSAFTTTKSAPKPELLRMKPSPGAVVFDPTEAVNELWRKRSKRGAT